MELESYENYEDPIESENISKEIEKTYLQIEHEIDILVNGLFPDAYSKQNIFPASLNFDENLYDNLFNIFLDKKQYSEYLAVNLNNELNIENKKSNPKNKI